MKLKIAVALVAVGSLAACSGGPTSPAAEKSVLTIAQAADITTFDPQNAFNTPTDVVLSNLFSHLLERAADNELVSDVAESVESVDALTWKVTLKDGVTFHNGDSLTCEDVKFTFERVATNQELAVQPYFSKIQEVKVNGPLDCDIVTSAPMPTLKIMTAFSGSWILPKKHIEAVGWPEFEKNPVGSGPFKFKEWVRDDRVVLERYEDYFQNNDNPWDEVIFRAIPESATRVAELLTGGVDLAVNIPHNEWQRIDDSGSGHLEQGKTSYVPILILRMTEGWPTADPLLREAIELALDRQKMAEVLYRDKATPTRTRMTPGTFGSQTKLYDQDIYDLEKAKATLAKSNYKGETLVLDAGRGRFALDAELAQMVAGMLEQAGIKVELKISDWSSFVNIYRAKENKDLLLVGLGDSLYDSSDSLLHYTIARAKGQTDYVNPTTDRLFAEAGENLDVDERRKQYQQIQDIVAKDRPHIPLLQIDANYGVSDRVEFVPFLNEMIKADQIRKK